MAPDSFSREKYRCNHLGEKQLAEASDGQAAIGDGTGSIGGTVVYGLRPGKGLAPAEG